MQATLTAFFSDFSKLLIFKGDFVVDFVDFEPFARFPVSAMSAKRLFSDFACQQCQHF
jgi:hypothetical protein